MRMNRLGLPTLLSALLLALPSAQAEVSATKLAQALGVTGLQVKSEAKRNPQQAHQDYLLNDASGNTVATVIVAPAASFADWKQVPGFQPVPGLGQEAYARPELNQLCARGGSAAACITLMPWAFPGNKVPDLEHRKAAVLSLL